MTLILSGTNGLSDVDGSAATPAIRGTDANTGIFFPAADTIAFSEGGAEVMRLDSSANLQFNSGYGSVATAYGCRAWVNFNGTGTVAIRASGNVTSITDNGTADYTVNFTTAMPDTNYCAVIYAYESSYYVINAAYGQTKNTGSFAIGGYYTNASSVTWSLSQRDIPQMNVAIFR
jgi:hypothetical protein